MERKGGRILRLGRKEGAARLSVVGPTYESSCRVFYWDVIPIPVMVMIRDFSSEEMMQMHA